MTRNAAAGYDTTAHIVLAGTSRRTPQPWDRGRLVGTWFMSYTTSGYGRFRVGPMQVDLSAGDVVLVHRDGAREGAVPGPDPWVYHWVSFDMATAWSPPPPFTRLSAHLYHAHIDLMHIRQRVAETFRQLIADVRDGDAAEVLARLRGHDTESHERVTGPLRELAVIGIREILLLVSTNALKTAQLDPRIIAALQVITDDLAAHHDLSALARMAGLSTSRFLHLFREQLDMPPRRAIRTLRLQQAALRLVYGNDPIGKIADEIGFSSAIDLNRGFRRAYGLSPTEYRQRFRTLSLTPRHRVLAADAGRRPRS